MSFDTDETGVQTNRPVELYTFVVGGTTFRRTSHPIDYTYSALLYTANAMVRSALAIKGAADQPEVSVQIPATDALAQAILPSLAPQGFTLTIVRVQQISGESKTIWQGSIDRTSAKGNVVSFRIPSRLDDPVTSMIPRAACQRFCNHVLYDVRCNRDGNTNRTDFDVITTITAVAGPVVTVASVGGNPDDWSKGGEIVLGTEHRLIIGQSGLNLTLNAPFQPALVAVLPVAATLYAGCDHTVETCRDKFDNVLNFGGHPRLDWKNPFITKWAWKA